MNYTEEQSISVYFDGENMVIEAGAGTGKTSVLKGYAYQNPKERMLYLCFNKAIQEEAEKTFPKNVVCRTGHAIAHARKGKPLQHKLTQNLRLTDVKNFLDTPSWGLVKDTIAVFNHFLVSADKKISTRNALFLAKGTSKQIAYAELAVEGATKMWAAATDPASKFPTTHDVYMKLYCLEKPELHTWFSTILLDEAQDTNPVLSDFIYQQKCKKIIVGDHHQQLYRFRGANNAMDKFVKEHNATVNQITQSFRFGVKIGNIASTILNFKAKKTDCKPFPIKGLESISDNVYLEFPPKLLLTQYTKLHRTVSGTINTAFDNRTKSIHWIGGLSNYNMQEILDVYYLSIDQKDKVKRKKLCTEFSTYVNYEKVAYDSQDIEMNRTVKLIKKTGNTLPRFMELLKRNEQKDPLKADIIIGTAHRSKGLEWDNVMLADDFPDLFDKENKRKKPELSDELNLLYVACTRAMFNLQINGVVQSILDNMGDIIAEAAEQGEIISKVKPKPTRATSPGTPSLRVKLTEE